MVAVSQADGGAAGRAAGGGAAAALPQLDPALRASARALGPEGRATLQAALEALLRRSDDGAPPPGARLALGAPARRRRRHGARARALRRRRLRRSGGAGGGAAASELRPPEPWSVAARGAGASARARPPARRAGGAGAARARPVAVGDRRRSGADVDRQAARRRRARQPALAALEACVVVDLPASYDPAWAEPTQPPRLLLPRRTLADEAVARFAAARAMHALVAGVALVDGRSDRRRGGAVARRRRALPARSARARARRRLRRLRARLAGGAVGAWRSIPSGCPRPSARGSRSCSPPPSSIRRRPPAPRDYARAERLTADRVALAATGDLRAALAALVPADADHARGARRRAGAAAAGRPPRLRALGHVTTRALIVVAVALSRAVGLPAPSARRRGRAPPTPFGAVSDDILDALVADGERAWQQRADRQAARRSGPRLRRRAALPPGRPNVLVRLARIALRRARAPCRRRRRRAARRATAFAERALAARNGKLLDAARARSRRVEVFSHAEPADAPALVVYAEALLGWTLRTARRRCSSIATWITAAAMRALAFDPSVGWGAPNRVLGIARLRAARGAAEPARRARALRSRRRRRARLPADARSPTPRSTRRACATHRSTSGLLEEVIAADRQRAARGRAGEQRGAARPPSSLLRGHR